MAPTTPNIDRLATRGVVFDDAISQSAWTRPAHISMMTGLYPVEHGVVSMSLLERLSPTVPTLASVLKSHGYATASFNGGGNLAAHFGLSTGFDVYRSLGKRLGDNVEGALDWLARAHHRPFFLFLHGFDAHRPYKSEAIDRHALGLPEEHARGLAAACRARRAPDDLARHVAEYDAAVHRGDRAVGRFLRGLEELGLAERTIVIVTSDHGEEFFEHGRCFHIYTVYREIVRVPLIVAIPGLPPGRVPGVVPASAGLAPTVLEILGLSEGLLPGPSLASDLVSGYAGFEFVVSETASRWTPRRARRGHVRAVTTNRDKLVHWLDHGFYEYFDVLSDPMESNPTSDVEREARLLESVEGWLHAHPRRSGVAISRARVPRRVERRLRALGYVQ